ncbi:MAG TPA: tripartite tricarboxylate transporter substrate-binding protein [Ramlibacter sp.]|nr:tripartite tricarboxylate transporter substrate-binding protein [Ramlibacter sp.]
MNGRLLTRRGAVAAVATFALAARAQENRGAIRVLVGYPPGGPADVVARLVADKLAAPLGQAVVVENRAGAGGLVAAQALKAAPADGSVLFLSNAHTVAMLPLIQKNPGFSTEKDFRTVGAAATFELALAAHPGTGATTAEQLGRWFAANPARSNIGVPAAGSAPELLGLALARQFRAEGVPVAYKGAAPLVQDLLAGQVPAGVSGVAEFLPHHQAGRLRIVALTRTTPLLPGVPSFADVGMPNLELTELLGLYAPAATPAAVVARYNEALQRVLQSGEVRDRLQALTMTPVPGTPADHAERLGRIQQAMAAAVRQTGYSGA